MCRTTRIHEQYIIIMWPRLAIGMEACLRGDMLPTQPSALVSAFLISLEGSDLRRATRVASIEASLRAAHVEVERWPAVRGSPTLLDTHAQHLATGFEEYLHDPHACGSKSGNCTILKDWAVGEPSPTPCPR